MKCDKPATLSTCSYGVNKSTDPQDITQFSTGKCLPGDGTYPTYLLPNTGGMTEEDYDQDGQNMYCPFCRSPSFVLKIRDNMKGTSVLGPDIILNGAVLDPMFVWPGAYSIE